MEGLVAKELWAEGLHSSFLGREHGGHLGLVPRPSLSAAFFSGSHGHRDFEASSPVPKADALK